ncbi:hypothetical protein KP509_08G067600 [Ceratopteris richardii]|uniref:C2H2-type domain-containing protein n=1 Tax=Ceratopteris richardii TaxID=49495 RepID=A0A8T2UBB6_CERRI|nr:hypothetical protein KP509_08G067600 [Ceratopteris richardii]
MPAVASSHNLRICPSQDIKSAASGSPSGTSSRSEGSPDTFHGGVQNHRSGGSSPTHVRNRSRGSFYTLGEAVGSSVDLNSAINAGFAYKVADAHKGDARHEEVYEGEDDHTGQEAELIYGLRQNPKRSRRLSDTGTDSQEQVRSSEVLKIKGARIANDHDSSSNPAESRHAAACVGYKKTVFTKLQEKIPAACTECGKEFSSWKALFGHMRCHPEREWRGIQPPPEYSTRTPPKNSMSVKPNSASNSDSKSFIIVKPLQSAPTQNFHTQLKSEYQIKPVRFPTDDAHRTAKMFSCNSEDLSQFPGCLKGNHEEHQWSRCRTQIMLEEEEESDTESIEAAYISDVKEDEDWKSLHVLATLPRGKRSKRSHLTIKSLRSVQDQITTDGVTDEQKCQRTGKEELEMATCLVMLALAGSDNRDEKEKQIGDQEAVLQADEFDAEDNIGDERSLVDQSLMLTWTDRPTYNAGVNQPRLTIDGSSSTIENIVGGESVLKDGEGARYECTACKRIFKSHQALGGHRASHKKVKGCFAKTAGDADAANCSPFIYREGLTGTASFVGAPILTLEGTCRDQSASADYTQPGPLLLDYGRARSDCKSDNLQPGTSIAPATGYNAKTAATERHNFTTASSLSATEGGQLSLLVGGVDSATCRPSKLLVNTNPSKYHQCSICQRVFSSGQALGGHKRCHWAADKTAAMAGTDHHRQIIASRTEITSVTAGRVAASAMAYVAAAPSKLKLFTRTDIAASDMTTQQVKFLDIDLNLPAPMNHFPYEQARGKTNASDRITLNKGHEYNYMGLIVQCFLIE